MFEPRLALASLSGESDAAWARAGAPYAGAAFLGGLSLDEETREAARTIVAERDREEFLPDDPLEFMREQLDAIADVPIRPGFNVRAIGPGAIRPAARICAERGAILEVNAHCRQEEMCAAGAGETLMVHGERLAAQVSAAKDEGAAVSVKVRAEVPDVDLPALAARLDEVGLDAIHVDAMDSEAVIAEIADASDAFVIANNGVRDERTTREYLAYGADAVSVGRASDDPAVLSLVSETVREWFA